LVHSTLVALVSDLSQMPKQGLEFVGTRGYKALEERRRSAVENGATRRL